MHASAMANGKSFFDCYGKAMDTGRAVTVVEIGSQDVNGSLKDVCPGHFKYVGVDFVEAKNVDVVLTDPYSLPFDDGSVDMVVTSSCLEHSEMFWLVFLEVLRVLSPQGLFYINVPSRGSYHRYPVDCWRFYPDSGIALSKWARRNGYDALLLESFTQAEGAWGDFVGVFLKDASLAARYPGRMLDHRRDVINGRQEAKGEEIFRPLKTNNGEVRPSRRKRPAEGAAPPISKRLLDAIRRK